MRQFYGELELDETSNFCANLIDLLYSNLLTCYFKLALLFLGF